MRAWSVVVGQESDGAPLQIPLYSALLILHAVAAASVIQDESDEISLPSELGPNLKNCHLKSSPLHNAIFTVPPRHGYDSAAIRLNKKLGCYNNNYALL